MVTRWRLVHSLADTCVRRDFVAVMMSPGQYGIRDILITTLVAGVWLGAWRVLGQSVGNWELTLLLISVISIILAFSFPRSRWPWVLGLLLCFVLVWHFGPRHWPSRLTVAVGSSYLYLFAGGPIAIVNPIAKFRWYWTLGAVTCAIAAVLFTPPDPGSTLEFAIPLSGFCVLVAYMWKENARHCQPNRHLADEKKDTKD